jgi:flagellar biosynthetic protein FliP
MISFLKRVPIKYSIFLCLVALGFGESITFDMSNIDGSITGRLIQGLIILTVLSIAPSIVVMATSFTRFLVVFSCLRNALGTQQSPPNMVMASLALFLTAYVMGPALETAYEQGLKPLINQKINEEEAFSKIVEPFHKFMGDNVRDKDLELFFNLSKTKLPEKIEQVPLKIMLPAFMISELRRAFEIAFLLFLPFVVIDLVVASLLMAMGMMMLSPVLISLPFKIIFFVLVDGWYLLCGSLIQGFR